MMCPMIQIYPFDAWETKVEENTKYVLYFANTDNKDSKFVKMIYFGPIPLKIVEIISKNKMNIVSQKSSNISELFLNGKGETNRDENSGVYISCCKNCNCVYLYWSDE